MEEKIFYSFPKSELISDLKTVIEETVKNHLEKNDSSNEELIDRKKVIEILSISYPTLNTWTKEGKIPAYRIGSRVRYKKQEIFDSLRQVRKYQKGGQNA